MQQRYAMVKNTYQYSNITLARGCRVVSVVVLADLCMPCGFRGVGRSSRHLKSKGK